MAPLGLRAVVLTAILAAHVLHAEICEERICEYNFVIRRSRTMIYHDDLGVHNVGLENGELILRGNSYRPQPWPVKTVNASDVITADGYERNIIVVNGRFPGPTIEVLKGSQIVVHVQNLLLTDGVTIHWHGLHLHGNFWMDGTAYVTQYPIMPRQNFTYRLNAEPVGTHWYHAHFMNQYIDGLYGFLIIHDERPTIPEHHILVSDWFREDALTKYILHPYKPDLNERGPGDMATTNSLRDYSLDGIEVNFIAYQSGLINGRGRHDTQPYPLSVFHVDRGKRYRIRFLNAAAEYAFVISIDEHPVTVVSLDGADINHVTVDSVVINPGERVDVHYIAVKKSGRYWLRAQTLRHGRNNSTIPRPEPDGIVQEIKAIITYTADDGSDPDTTKRTCSESNSCTTFNCPYVDFISHTTCLNIDNVTSVDDDVRESFGLNADEVNEIMLNINFHMGANINGFQYVPPTSPFYRRYNEDTADLCDDSSVIATGEVCKCTHTRYIPYNQTIQLVVSNLNPTYGTEHHYLAHHPMHLHGYHFAVVAVGYPLYNTTTRLWHTENPDITCESSICREPRWTNSAPAFNLHNPPIKDTVTVPAHGYAVLRFRSTNPGQWVFHCHSESHFHEGMAILLTVAPERLLSPPLGIDVQGSFTWSAADYESYFKRGMLLTETGNGQDTKNASEVTIDRWVFCFSLVVIFVAGAFSGVVILKSVSMKGSGSEEYIRVSPGECSPPEEYPDNGLHEMETRNEKS